MPLDFAYSPLAEFSRDHCLAICAFLVPVNLLITLQTLILVTLNRPQPQLQRSVAISLPFALILALHVGTWLAIGVVHPFTFILLTLATVCLLLNLATLAYAPMIRAFILQLLAVSSRFLPIQQFKNGLKQEVVR